MSAAPTFQAATANTNGTGNLTRAWPTHAIDDVAFLLVETDTGTITLNTANGFVQVGSQVSATGVQLAVFWCRATSASMASPVVASKADHQNCAIVTFRNCKRTGDPWEASATASLSTAGTTKTYPLVTTLDTNRLIVGMAAGGLDTSSAWNTTLTNANLTSPTERLDVANNSGNGGGLHAFSGGKDAAGSTGTTSSTQTSSVAAMMTLALVGHDTVTAQVATATFTAIPSITDLYVIDQPATATFTAVPGTPVVGGVSLSAQIALATFEAVPGTASAAPSGDTVTAQIATASFEGIAGSSIVGGATVTAQVATGTFTAVAGTKTLGGVSTTAQVATGTFTAVAGTKTLGGVTTTAQVATATFTGVAGTKTLGGVTTTAQIASAVFSGIAGTKTLGGVSTSAQVATASFTGIAGVGSTSGGSQTQTAQVASATFSALAGAPLSGGISVFAQVAFGTFTALPGIPSTASTYKMKWWNGTAWVPVPIKMYDTAWTADQRPKAHTGSDWVSINS